MAYREQEAEQNCTECSPSKKTTMTDNEMRTLLVSAVSSIVALIGFTSTANATATIDLYWGSPGGSTSTGIGASSSAVLHIVLTNTEQMAGYSLSVDYSDASAKYSVVTFTHTHRPLSPSVL